MQLIRIAVACTLVVATQVTAYPPAYVNGEPSGGSPMPVSAGHFGSAVLPRHKGYSVLAVPPVPQGPPRHEGYSVQGGKYAPGVYSSPGENSEQGAYPGPGGKQGKLRYRKYPKNEGQTDPKHFHPPPPPPPPPPVPPANPTNYQCPYNYRGYFYTYDRTPGYLAAQTCQLAGGALVDVNQENFKSLVEMIVNCMGPYNRAWIRSWDTNTYGDSTLALFTGSRAGGGSVNIDETSILHALCSSTFQPYPQTDPIPQNGIDFAPQNFVGGPDLHQGPNIPGDAEHKSSGTSSDSTESNTDEAESQTEEQPDNDVSNSDEEMSQEDSEQAAASVSSQLSPFAPVLENEKSDQNGSTMMASSNTPGMAMQPRKKNTIGVSLPTTNGKRSNYDVHAAEAHKERLMNIVANQQRKGDNTMKRAAARK